MSGTTSFLTIRLRGRDRVLRPPAKASIGRKAGVDLEITDERISSLHAEVSWEGDNWVFEDRSTNGSYRDGRPVSRIEINEAITLRLGHPSEGVELTLTPAIADPAEPEKSPRPMTPRQVQAVSGSSGPRRRDSTDGSASGGGLVVGLPNGRSQAIAPPGPAVVGREGDIRVTHSRISRRHLELRQERERWTARDLGSNNGTFREGVRVDQVEVDQPVTLHLGHPTEGLQISLKPGSARTERVPTVGDDLTVVVEGSKRTLTPTQGRVILGRESDIPITDQRVSGEHAALFFHKDRWVIEDLNSRNGTFQDGSPVTRLEITEQITLRLGHPSDGQEVELRPSRTIAAPWWRSTRLVAPAAALALVAAMVGVVLARSPPSESGLDAATRAHLKQITVQIIVALEGGGTGVGSGTIISPDGLILTNAHVAAPDTPGLRVSLGSPELPIPPAAELYIAVFQSDDEPPESRYRAEVLAADGWLDLAVIQIVSGLEDNSPVGSLDLPWVEIGDSQNLVTGDDVFIFGYPGVAEGRLDPTFGKVGAPIPDHRADPSRGWYNTDARIAPGNSGGLAADVTGQIVGVPTLIRQATEPSEPPVTVGRLRPVHLAQPLIEAAQAGETYVSPYIVDPPGPVSLGEASRWTTLTEQQRCGERVEAYPEETRALAVDITLTGIVDGVDYMARWFELEDGNWSPVATSAVTRWDGGPGCFIFSQEGEELVVGSYGVVIYAGPYLEPVGDLTVRVGAGPTDEAGTSATTESQDGADPLDQPEPEDLPEPGPPASEPGGLCGDVPLQQWTWGGVGVELGEAKLSDGRMVSDGGRYTLENRVGDPQGYSRLEDAAQVAFNAMLAVDQAAHFLRWVVLDHAGHFHVFNARRHEEAFFHAGGLEGFDINPDPGPCILRNEAATLQAWYAKSFELTIRAGGLHSEWIGYEWIRGEHRAFRLP